MEKREERRDRDWRYGARARAVRLRVVRSVLDSAFPRERSAWSFRKGKALGCRGSKKGAAGTSKRGSCCKGGFELRSTVLERRRGSVLCRAAMREVDALDFEG